MLMTLLSLMVQFCPGEEKRWSLGWIEDAPEKRIQDNFGMQKQREFFTLFLR